MKLKKLKEFEPIFETEATVKQMMEDLDNGNEIKVSEYCISSCKGSIIKRKETLKTTNMDKNKKKKLKILLKMDKQLLKELYRIYVRKSRFQWLIGN